MNKVWPQTGLLPFLQTPIPHMTSVQVMCIAYDQLSTLNSINPNLYFLSLPLDSLSLSLSLSMSIHQPQLNHLPHIARMTL